MDARFATEASEEAAPAATELEADHPPPPASPTPFVSHRVYSFPDCPPVTDPTITESPVFSFTLHPTLAATINTDLSSRERLAELESRANGGLTVSNVGGFHSEEEEWSRGIETELWLHATEAEPPSHGQWYSRLNSVVRAALRHVAGGKVSCEEASITGWLNASPPTA